MLRKKIKEEIAFYNRCGMNGKRRVALKTVGRIVALPVKLAAKVYEWVYYDETDEKLDRIIRGF
jgi:hypothetical protein